MGLVENAEIRVRGVIVGIDRQQQSIRFHCLGGITRNRGVIPRLDIEPLTLADPLSQFVRPGRCLFGFAAFAEVAEHSSKAGMGEREVRVELDGATKQRYRVEISLRPTGRHALAVRFEGLERRRRRGLDVLVVALDHGQRLAEPLAKARGGLTQRGDHSLFGCRLDLLLGKSLAGLAILSTEGKDVAAAQAGNRASQHGFGPGS